MGRRDSCSPVLPPAPPPLSWPNLNFPSQGVPCIREAVRGGPGCRLCLYPGSSQNSLLTSCSHSTAEPTTPLKAKEATKKKKKQFGKKSKWCCKAAVAGVGPVISWACVPGAERGPVTSVVPSWRLCLLPLPLAPWAGSLCLQSITGNPPSLAVVRTPRKRQEVASDRSGGPHPCCPVAETPQQLGVGGSPAAPQGHLVTPRGGRRQSPSFGVISLGRAPLFSGPEPSVGSAQGAAGWRAAGSGGGRAFSGAAGR